MIAATFHKIDHCPVCLGSDCEDYLNLPYVASDVQGFLFRYYKLDKRFGIEAYEQTFSGQDYILATCRTCGVHFQRNRPDAALATIVYDEWIGAAASGRRAFERYGLTTVQHYVSEALRLVAVAQKMSGTARLTDLRTLDYGMGNGGFAMALKSCLVDVSGAEFSEVRRAFAEENGISTFGVGEPLPDQHFHLINTEQVMEHLPNPHEVLGQFANALVPGGLLKISVPLSKSIEAGDREIDWHAERYAPRSPTPLQPLEHLQYYKRSSYETLEKLFGFRRVHIPFSYHLRYGLNWTLKGAIKNIGRAFLHERQRNYVLLQKT